MKGKRNDLAAESTCSVDGARSCKESVRADCSFLLWLHHFVILQTWCALKVWVLLVKYHIQTQKHPTCYLTVVKTNKHTKKDVSNFPIFSHCCVEEHTS